MSSSLDKRKPEIKVVNVESRHEFMRHVVGYCIDRYPDLADLVHRGRMTFVMLEHLTILKGLIIGRKGGSYY